GNYTYISPEIKQLMVSLSDHYKTRDIADICQVSPRTVRRVLELWRRRGEVVRVPIVQGRPRGLDALDLAYLESCIERTPDVYLYELRTQLRTQLEDARGTDVDESTIARSL
ncbi:hypothetical protein FIBSPDRAFT_707505, partial [Athelia psychrophila]